MLALEAWMWALLYSWSKVSPQHSTVQEFQRLRHCRIQLLSPPVSPLATEQDVQTGKGRPADPEDPMAEGEKQLPQGVLRPPHVYHSKCGGGERLQPGNRLPVPHCIHGDGVNSV